MEKKEKIDQNNDPGREGTNNSVKQESGSATKQKTVAKIKLLVQ